MKGIKVYKHSDSKRIVSLVMDCRPVLVFCLCLSLFVDNQDNIVEPELSPVLCYCPIERVRFGQYMKGEDCRVE